MKKKVAIISLSLLFIFCSQTEKEYYNSLKEMKIESKVYDAYFDKTQKGRYVIVIKYKGNFLKINNTFLLAPNSKIKKGDSLYKPAESMDYHVFNKDGKVLIFNSNSFFK